MLWSMLCLKISCPSPRINHFSKEPWRTVLETKIWILNMLVAIGCSFFYARSADRKKTYVCVY